MLGYIDELHDVACLYDGATNTETINVRVLEFPRSPKYTRNYRGWDTLRGPWDQDWIDHASAIFTNRLEVFNDPVYGESISVDHLAATANAVLLKVCKVFVLLALAWAVEESRLGWTDELTTGPQSRSLPTGEMQDLPDGTRASLAQVAYNMYARSDNAASDMVIRHLGRETVEAAVARSGHDRPELLRPFLATRELFDIGWGHPDTLGVWQQASESGRRALLNAHQHPVEISISDLTSLVHPRGLDWWMSAADVVAAMAALWAAGARAANGPLPGILAANPGVDIDRASWPRSTFKGVLARGRDVHVAARRLERRAACRRPAATLPRRRGTTRWTRTAPTRGLDHPRALVVSARDKVLAFVVALIWGLNFLAVRLASDAFPPLFLAALRYLIVAPPVVFLVPRPSAPWRWLVGYGLGFGVLQFGFLFLAIDLGMPTGLSAVVLQMGAPMTIELGALLLRERPSTQGVLGAILATVGLCFIGWERTDGVRSLLPFALTLIAALGWALGSLSSRLAQPDSALRFALWMAVVPPLPLLVMSAVLEGPTAGWDATVNVVHDGAVAPLLALLYIVVSGTVVSAAIWSALLKKYPAGVVAPFAMLVPVVAIAAAWVVLDERSSCCPPAARS